VIFIVIRFIFPLFFGEMDVIGIWWQVVVFTPVMLFFGGLEEIGWRGFLQPKLENKFGFIAATFINTVIWVVWHIPLCFINGTYQYSNNFLWFVVSLTGMAFSLAAIRKVTRNIFACILYHAAINAIMSYGVSVQDGIGIIVSAAVQIALAVLLVLLHEKHQKSIQARMSRV
jgi:membrane protease YdiL (CAAX protease family)